jgi:hypothetical protein
VQSLLQSLQGLLHFNPCWQLAAAAAAAAAEQHAFKAGTGLQCLEGTAWEP